MVRSPKGWWTQMELNTDSALRHSRETSCSPYRRCSLGKRFLRTAEQSTTGPAISPAPCFSVATRNVKTASMSQYLTTEMLSKALALPQTGTLWRTALSWWTGSLRHDSKRPCDSASSWTQTLRTSTDRHSGTKRERNRSKFMLLRRGGRR